MSIPPGWQCSAPTDGSLHRAGDQEVPRDQGCRDERRGRRGDQDW